jgi:hypothetical protein
MLWIAPNKESIGVRYIDAHGITRLGHSRGAFEDVATFRARRDAIQQEWHVDALTHPHSIGRLGANLNLVNQPRRFGL